MDNERYPAQKKVWICPKCESTSFTEDTVTVTGKTWSRFMNIQNRKFLAITCTNCCLLYTSPSPRDVEESRMPSSA